MAKLFLIIDALPAKKDSVLIPQHSCQAVEEGQSKKNVFLVGLVQKTLGYTQKPFALGKPLQSRDNPLSFSSSSCSNIA